MDLHAFDGITFNMSILQEKLGKDTLTVVGLISGTSADGIDAAVVRFNGKGFKVLEHSTTPYPEEVRHRLFDFFEDRATLREVARMDRRLGELFAQVVEGLQDRHQIDLVASHGQTVCHLPEDGVTMQIGQGAVIAKKSGLLTVSDFRPDDMALGGQGAPLVPFFDAFLLQDGERARAALNVGGIANLTFLDQDGNVRGLDTGPGNCLSDAFTELHTGASFDRNGALAAQGRVDDELLKEWLQHPYFARELPKSTGREDFGLDYARKFWGRLEPVDLIRTALALSAQTVVDHLARYGSQVTELVAAGGGCDNPVLMAELRERLPEKVELKKFDDYGVPTSAREAVAFAYLGLRALRGLTNSSPGATGASRAAVLGKLSFP